jgi:hypothetical protein
MPQVSPRWPNRKPLRTAHLQASVPLGGCSKGEETRDVAAKKVAPGAQRTRLIDFSSTSKPTIFPSFTRTSTEEGVINFTEKRMCPMGHILPKAELGSSTTQERASKVVRCGIPEVIKKMDKELDARRQAFYRRVGLSKADSSPSMEQIVRFPFRTPSSRERLESAHFLRLPSSRIQR